MSHTMTFPIPFDKAPQAMALCMADVIKAKKAGKKLVDQPFAKAFYKHYFGTATPKKADVKFIVTGELSIPVITREVNALIESNGGYRGRLSHLFIEMLFPCLALSLETRFDNNFELKATQSAHVERKHQTAHEATVARYEQQAMTLDSKGLSGWVRESQDELSNWEQWDILKKWYGQSGFDSYEFGLYYSDMTAREIALDLSYM